MSNKLSIKEKLEIANSGDQFQETGQNSWVGVKIRKGQKLGVVICDLNGIYRTLTVRFFDGTKDEIKMNNIGPDLESVHQFEWLVDNDEWYRF